MLPAAFPPGGGPDAVCLPEQRSTGLLVPPAVLIPGCLRRLLAALPDAGARRGGYQLVSTATNQNFHPPPGPGTWRTSPDSITTPGSTGNEWHEDHAEVTVWHAGGGPVGMGIVRVRDGVMVPPFP